MFFKGGKVYIYQLYILILCTNAVKLSVFERFPGNLTRYRRQLTCGDQAIQCKSGECIAEDQLCDGAEDCRDGSDENDCLSIPCNTRFLFKCAYGACISKQFECDGKKDCKDNSDETSPKCATLSSTTTSSVANFSCGETKFECISGECIDDSFLCDGKAHCTDGSDETEERCNKFPCPKSTFRCNYGACISRSDKCNGENDCVDGSDEVGCPSTSPPDPVTPVTPRITTVGPPPVEGSCTVPNDPPNGYYTVAQSPREEYPPGSYATPYSSLITHCARKHNPTPPDGGFSLCINGAWTPTPLSCAQSCYAVNSSSTTKVECTFRGRALVSCDAPVEGTFAKISCEPLHEDPGLARSPLRVCNDGSWDRPFSKCYPICGEKRPLGRPNVINGKNVTKGDYPWHVGIYHTSTKENICGGSLINSKVVVSAAHCFTDESNGAKYPAKNYEIAAGKYYRKYDEEQDEHAQYSNVETIHIPTRYKGTITQYEADIAVLILANKLTYTESVQPVCIDWAGDTSSQEIYSVFIKGTVVGWGQTKEGRDPSAILKELSVPAITFEQCYEQVPKSFRKFLTHDKLCAGFLDNATAVCQGDSGGGLTFPNRFDRYFLRGVVSTSPATIERACDSNQYGTYTLVSKYIDFIQQYGYLD